MDEESDGSIRLLDFIPMLIDLGNNEVDYLIDELDRSMHPLLSQKLIECYLHDLSDRDTQLIISTHECNLLNLDMIRSDEVWFVRKTQTEHPVLYPLPNITHERMFRKIIFKAIQCHTVLCTHRNSKLAEE